MLCCIRLQMSKTHINQLLQLIFLHATLQQPMTFIGSRS